MSFWSKHVEDIGYDDLKQLKADGAQENTRLEFIGEFEDPADTRKKISAFANSYGGYIILGAAEDGKGRLSDLPGVSPNPGYIKSLTDLCYQRIYPPVIPFFSSEIPHTESEGKVFYVIYVEQSMEAPHFLNDRQGCYVRTAERGQKVESVLATYDEIMRLTDRRKLAVETRNYVIKRAQERFKTRTNWLAKDVGDAGMPRPFLEFTMVPAFPGPATFSMGLLAKYMEFQSQAQLSGGAGAMPPPHVARYGTHHEGCFVAMLPRNSRPGLLDVCLSPGVRFQYLEIDIHGLLYCGVALCATDQPGSDRTDLPDLVRKLARYLDYGKNFYTFLGFEGLLHIKIHMKGMSGTGFVIGPNKEYPEGRVSPEDEFDFSLEKSTRDVTEDSGNIVGEVVETVCIACDQRWFLDQGRTALEHCIQTSLEKVTTEPRGE